MKNNDYITWRRNGTSDLNLTLIKEHNMFEKEESSKAGVRGRRIKGLVPVRGERTERMNKARCIEADLLAEGLEQEARFKAEYTGENAGRSESRLYPLYSAITEILKLAGKVDIKAQGVNDCKKSELTVHYVGNTYGDFIAKTQVSPDIVYRNSDELSKQLHGIEVRAGSSSLEKNIYNNSRALTGEEVHFNDIIRRESGVQGNYFKVMGFVERNNKEFSKVVNSFLHLSETGHNVALVPFVVDEAGKVEVLLGAVPSQIQLMRLLRDI